MPASIRTLRSLLLALGALLCSVHSALAFVEATGDIVTVNDTMTGPHGSVKTATSGSNQTLWVWHGEGAGDTFGIFGKLTSTWTEFRINDSAAETQRHPSADWDPEGETCVVVWQHETERVIMRQFDLQGNPLTDDLPIVGNTGEQVLRPIVRFLPEGKLAVAWHIDDAGEDAILVQGFRSDGNPFTDVIEVSSSDSPKQTMTMEVNEEGVIVIAWSEQEPSGSWRIHATTFDPSFEIENQDFSGFGPPGNQAQPDIGFLESGDILMVWYQGPCFTQVCDYDGDMQGTWSRINLMDGSGQFPSVDRSAQGWFVVAWHYDDDVAMRCLNPNGVPVGDDVIVGVPTNAHAVDLVFNGDTNFLVSWTGDSPTSAIADVFAQDFGPATSDVGDPPPPAPALETSSRPTVFRQATSIRYELTEPARVSVSIFDVQGRQVRSLLDQVPSASGVHQVQWDGTSDERTNVPAGTYFYRIGTGDRTAGGRLVRVR